MSDILNRIKNINRTMVMEFFSLLAAFAVFIWFYQMIHNYHRLKDIPVTDSTGSVYSSLAHCDYVTDGHGDCRKR